MAKVLVADDDPSMRDVIYRKLKAAGHDVATEEDGTAVLAAAESAVPEDRAHDAIAAGADDYLPKPFDLNELRDMVGAAVEPPAEPNPDLGYHQALATARQQQSKSRRRL